MRNLITDVPGLKVGHAHDARCATGVTVVLCDEPTIAAVDVRGGGPGTREADLLDPAATVEKVDAIVLSGGSAFGLDAAAGVMIALAAAGRGFAVGPARVPIVPGAVLFDLNNGGDKAWGLDPPYRHLGRDALHGAGLDFPLGTIGAGYGATTAIVKGGLGSASAVLPSGHVVGAVVAVNAVGSPLFGAGPHFRAAPYERHAEFGGLGLPATFLDEASAPALKGHVPLSATTLAVVACDAVLTTAQAHRLAVMAQDGLALSLFPIHTPLDGDCVFTLATGRRPLAAPIPDLARIGACAAAVLARAVARAVFSAKALPFPGAQPSWRDLFGAPSAPLQP
ncbi:P1 family peptidase [Xanthobacter agilis]|uniref:L-aminopeptidase/D-esterase-like protein n=1 Tax=Xanthobacter agilis TaxID=47492 RepID=A0ABU0LCN3_XANAG|nr:P1 family peptidase [Xanthobacter agilis]MDQ0504853.1 L-aminopeptidase/D-esterase-like protein [Xanthobacter agilis]